MFWGFFSLSVSPSSVYIPSAISNPGSTFYNHVCLAFYSPSKPLPLSSVFPHPQTFRCSYLWTCCEFIINPLFPCVMSAVKYSSPTLLYTPTSPCLLPLHHPTPSGQWYVCRWKVCQLWQLPTVLVIHKTVIRFPISKHELQLPALTENICLRLFPVYPPF